MMAPGISVIIPVYNGEMYIESTVKSVIQYGYDYGVELIVVNDGSTDSTLKVLQAFESSIKLISTPNRGESSAVNTGINSASNNILLVVSADDPIFTHRIFLNVVEFFENNPSSVALYSDWRLIDEQGDILYSKFPGKYSEQELIGNFHCQPGPGTFFRKSSAIQIGGRSQRWKFVGDYDFWLRLSRVGDFGYRNEVLAQWRSHGNSTSIAQRGLLMAQERITVIEEFVEKESISGTLKRDALSAAYISAAQLSYFSSEIPAKFYLWSAFKKAKRWPKTAKMKIVLFVLLTPFSRRAIGFVERLRSK
jgi:glycosyltransferase involved in cell wall biosynthesis